MAARSKKAARRRPTTDGGWIAREYERGRDAPFSPATPESSGRDSPAVREARRKSLSEDAPAQRKTRAKRTRSQARRSRA
jgi:hypothetical protein